MWWISQYYQSSTVPSGPGFKKGANPFAKTSQEPLDLLESITAIELASCVPFVKIEKIDKLGQPDTSMRPLMYDLTQGPGFNEGEDFGLDSNSFLERSLVSLNRLTVEFQQQYGQQLNREITIEFTVHRPDVVFDRTSEISWRQIMQPGMDFTLEYGWRGDTNLVRNPLFNGDGHITEAGQVLKSTQLIMLRVYNYSLQTTATGEVKVTVKALENGDLCLRSFRFSDAFEASIGSGFIRNQPDDVDNINALKGLLNRLTKKHGKGKDEYYLMGDILDNVIAPMIVTAGKLWGYTSVDLLLGKFNRDAGPQSDRYFGEPMADRGIEDFRIPVDVLLAKLQTHAAKGRALLLQNFISILIQTMNGEGPWKGGPYEQPNVLMKSETVKTESGIRLIMIIHDIKVGSHPFGKIEEGKNRIAIDKQSKEAVFEKLRSLGVPILEFARAGSLITDSSFNIQTDGLLQATQIDTAYKDQKSRVQESKMPDVESRKGQARNGELIMPISILEGEVQMHGNFAMEVFGRLWIDYFGSKEISGVFSVMGKTDQLEPGTFRSTFKMMSESIDPLNTRRQRSEEELNEAQERGKKLRAQKPTKDNQVGSSARSNGTTAAPKITGTPVRRGGT